MEYVVVLSINFAPPVVLIKIGFETIVEEPVASRIFTSKFGTFNIGKRTLVDRARLLIKIRDVLGVT